jgi:hypothetical protein
VTLASIFTDAPNAAELTAAYQVACEAASKIFTSPLVSLNCINSPNASSAIAAGVNGVVGDGSSTSTTAEAFLLGKSCQLHRYYSILPYSFLIYPRKCNNTTDISCCI